ncbi:MAG: UvrD-helicase domain-containing protein [Planctomycetota bacterium]
MSLRDLGAELRRARRARRAREARGEPAEEGGAVAPIAFDARERPAAGPASIDPVLNSTAASSPTTDTPISVDDAAVAARLASLSSSHPALATRLRALDPEQRAAILAEGESVLVEAQVGSGKTTVLAHRVLTLHLAEGVPLEEMAVLTFTRKAAREITDRVRGLLEAPPPPEAFAGFGTFHAVARSLLERSGRLDRFGRRPGFGVLDAAARRALLLEIAREAGLVLRYEKKLDRRLEAARAGRWRYGAMRKDDDLPRLVALYEEEKRRRNVFDFDDLVERALEIVPELEPERRPRWIVVDELQDCDERQLAFLAAWAGEGTRFFGVGDPRQVIYSWRGSRPEIFAAFESRFGARRVTLARNYRSRPAILAVAGAVLGAQAGPLRAAREGGRPVVVRRHHDPLAETVYLTARIRALLEEGCAPGEIAVLTRTREPLAALEEGLAAAGLPVARRGVDREPERRELRDWLLRLLAAVLRPEDTGAAARLLADSAAA